MNFKKTLLAAICITSCATAYAETASTDTSANLQVSGTVNDTESNCSISLNKTNILLQSADASALPDQGGEVVPSNVDTVTVNMVGDKCKHTGLKFIGQTDTTEGNTLVNSLQTASAAKGVGVGIYKANGYALDLSETVSPTWDIYEGRYPIHMRLVKLNGETPTMGDVQASLTVQLESL